jgi:hypothetical protein
VLPTLTRNHFSIVYLDASHEYRDVQRDIKLSMLLLREGGILCGDDLELQLSEMGEDELAEDVATNKDFVKSRRCNVFYHPGVTRAVAEAFGEVSAWEGYWAIRKTASGWQKVDLSRCHIETPQHIASVESAPTESSTEMERLLAMVDKIEKQSTGCQDQNVPQLISSYSGFNIVRFKGSFYGVRQSLGEIDWTLSDAELGKIYSESDFIKCSDTDTIINGIGLRELRHSIEKLCTILVERQLRQEVVIAALAARIADVGAGEFRSPERGEDGATYTVRRVPVFYSTTQKDPRLLYENYKGFNLVAYDGKVLAIDITSGPVDLSEGFVRDRLATEGLILTAATLDGSRAAVDARVLDRRMQGIESRLDEITTVASDLQAIQQFAQDATREFEKLRRHIGEFKTRSGQGKH